MNYPTRPEIRKLTAKPEYYAEEMTINQIDKVVAAFIQVRLNKPR
jgi:hypothetical protein